MIPDFLLKWAGRWAAKKADLKEGPMETKPWYQSKTIWSDVATIVISIVGFVDTNFTHGHITASPVYQGILTFLGAFGIYTRSTATAKITS